MTLKELKQFVRIADYLQVEEREKDFFIFSPFRQERTPSFKINPAKNTWFDFGRGEGGTIIDLIAKLENLTIKEAVKRLREIANDTHETYKRQNYALKRSITHERTQSSIKILKTQKLQNKALIRYLEERKINIEYAKLYTQEIYYETQNGRYFAIAFENQSQGYELRNKYFKGAIGKKDITIIAGEKRKECVIFEGFIDFLSYLTLRKTCTPKTDCIVLNSVALLNRAREVIKKKSYVNLFLALDNDLAGDKATQELLKLKNAVDCRDFYKNYKDLNDYIKDLKIKF